MSTTIPDVAAGDVQVTAINARNDLIEAAVNTLDGAAISAATVPNSALAKRKNMLAIPVSFEALSGLADNTKFADIELPPIDEALNSTYAFHGVSVWLRASTPAAANSIEIQEDGVVKQTIDLSGATLTTAAYVGFGDATLLAPVATATGKNWSCVFQKSGGPTYTGLLLVLFFSLEHNGT